jgi:hypothetical protein
MMAFSDASLIVIALACLVLNFFALRGAVAGMSIEKKAAMLVSWVVIIIVVAVVADRLWV